MLPIRADSRVLGSGTTGPIVWESQSPTKPTCIVLKLLGGTWFGLSAIGTIDSLQLISVDRGLQDALWWHVCCGWVYD